MKLNYVSEEFALTILETAIARNTGMVGGKELKDIVAGAVQICIEADRAVHDYLKNPSGSSVTFTVKTEGRAATEFAATSPQTRTCAL